MTNLTFYGGVGEIGGNKVLLEDGDARIWLDMGSTFDFGSEYFVEYLTPRERFGLRDYFALGLLPRLPGLYAADWRFVRQARRLEPVRGVEPGQPRQESRMIFVPIPRWTGIAA